MRYTTVLFAFALGAAAFVASPASAKTGVQAIFLTAPAAEAPPSVKLAVQFELNLRLPEGKGLARMLLDAGVDRDDAATAARLAAGHLGDGQGGCEAKVSIQAAPSGAGFRLVRVQLSSHADLTVIERRASELTVAFQAPASASFHIA